MSKTRAGTSDKRFVDPPLDTQRQQLVSEIQVLEMRKRSLMQELGTVNTNLELKQRALLNMNTPAGATESSAL